MPKKTERKKTVKKDKQINNQIQRKRKHFELEDEASQVGFKNLTIPSTDFPLAYGNKKSIEEIMADNYDEINESFKLQAQHLLVATSSESDELLNRPLIFDWNSDPKKWKADLGYNIREYW